MRPLIAKMAGVFQSAFIRFFSSRSRHRDTDSSADTASASASSPSEGQSEQPQANYSSDQPISSKAEDRFNRWPFAERTAKTLAACRDPSSLVIGIYGVWGDGKTSTLRLMQEALKEHANIVCVGFNPWHFASEDQLLRGFFATLAEALGKSLPTKKEEIGKVLGRYGSILSLASVTVGGVVQVDPGAMAKGLGEALSTVTLDDLRQRLEAFLREGGKRVVVFIDDIDRLDRTDVQAMFKLVKLSASFDYTSYVLAFDDEMVAAALGEKYGQGDVAAGRNFIEKIVQVPLHLPPADELPLRKLTFEGVDGALQLSAITLSQEQVDAFVRHFIDGIEPRLNTPRQAKLYTNALAFALPILKGEVHPVDHMLIEGIRIFYPKLYANIRDNPEYFLKDGGGNGQAQVAFRQRAKTLIDEGLAGLGVDKDIVRRRLLEVLFPRLQGVFGNVRWGHEWDARWNREQRISSEDYFKRYFSYSVPPGDVSDLKITTFIDSAKTMNDEGLNRALREFSDMGGMPQLILKLRRREEQVDRSACAKLALAVARNGDLLPRQPAMLFSDRTTMQAGILIAHLVKQSASDADARAGLGRRVISEAEPLSFAFECLRWLRKGERESDAERIVTEAVDQELRSLLATRVRESATTEPPYKRFGQDAPSLLWAWNQYGTQGEVGNYLRGRLTMHEEEVDELLDVYVGTALGLESGLSHRSDFDRGNYDTLAKLVDPEFILERLKARYGAELDNPEYYHGDEVPFRRRVAHQFAYIHKKIKEDRP